MGGERRRRTGNVCEENEDTGDESHNCEWKTVGRVYGLSERDGEGDADSCITTSVTVEAKS